MSPRPLASACVLALALLAGRSSHAELAVTVRGDPACPSADMVRAAVYDISPDAQWMSETVMVDVSPERLSLTLGDEQTARRDIPAPADCQARAEAVALVVRAWSGDLPAHPTVSPMLTVAAPAPAPAQTKISKHAVELDGAVFYSPLWGHAPGIWLGVGRTPRAGGLGFRVLGAYQSARDLALASGRNQLSRAYAGAAPTLHVQRESLFASAEVGLVVTLTRAQGDGYTSDERASTWNLGALADVRGGAQLGRFRVWLNARLLRLFHQETITIASSGLEHDDTSRLNAWDTQLGIGMGARFE